MSIKQRGWCRCAGCGKLGRGGAEKHTQKEKKLRTATLRI